MRKRLALLFLVGLMLGGSAVWAADPVDPNLVGWWKLDDGAGTVAADSSGRGHDGRFVGEPLWTDGLSGSALQFDGVDDYVLCAERSGTGPGVYPKELMPSGGFTVACWVKLDQFAYFSSFVGNGIDTGDDECGFFLYNFGWSGENGRDFGLAIRTESGMFYVETPNIYTTGTWYHLAATYDGRDVRIYVNGAVAVGPQAVGGPIRWISQASGNHPERFSIGVWLDPGYQLWVDGAIDDVRYYNRALPDAQVKSFAFRPKAHDPDPPDGAAGVASPLFRWTAGSSALFHNVYLRTSPDLGATALVGARLPVAMHYQIAGLTPGVTYYWRVDEIEKDGVTTYTGDTWSFTVQALTAYHPTPADGAMDASPTAVLAWLPGQAAVEHRLYFSDSRADVNDAAPVADKGKLAETTFTPGPLASLTTYYWRVDETVATGGVKAGPVWTFTTCLPVDDFENYTDDVGNEIFSTWVDGYSTNWSTGSTVGYEVAPFAEQKIVHGGKQSMPLDFNNIKSPYYSEAERPFETARDWTADGATTLILYVRGKSSNGSTPVYLKLEDASKKAATIIHPNPALSAATNWTQWKIPLSEFTGVNLAKVRKMIIGVGDTANPKAGGRGLLYIDDIALTK